MARKHRKAANGAGSVRWYPSMRRFVGQVRRGSKIIKRVYGERGDDSAAQKTIVLQKLRPYLLLPDATDATVTLQSCMDRFANRKTRNGKPIAPSTRDCYKNIVGYVDRDGKRHPGYLDRLGAKRVIDVKSGDIRDALDNLAGDPKRGATMNRTRQIAYVILSGVFSQAKKDKLITDNPMDAVDMPTYQREGDPVVFTSEEQRVMQEQVRGTDYEAMLLLAFSMPLRSCELFGLRRCEVSIARREIKVRYDLIETKENGYQPTLGPPKTAESRRELPLSDEVAAALAKHLERQLGAGRSTPESFVFTSPDGGPIRHSNFTRRWWKPLLESAAVEANKAARERGDLDYSFPVQAGLYDLRHTAMENLKAAGVPLDVFHILCGHKTIATSLKHYNRPTQARRQEAAAMVSAWMKERAVATP